MFIFVPFVNWHWDYIPDDAKPRACSDTKGITALDDAGLPVAVTLLDSWTFNACQIHLWIGNPFVLKHGYIEEVFGYVFGDESGRGIVIASMASDNPKALKFNKHLGFEDLFVIPDGNKVGVDTVVRLLRKENCRWIVQRLNVVGE